MTGDAGTPLTAKWQIIELDEAQGIGSVEIEDGFTLRHEISFHSAMNPSSGPDNDDFFSSLLGQFDVRSLPIRLSPTPTICSVHPFS